MSQSNTQPLNVITQPLNVNTQPFNVNAHIESLINRAKQRSNMLQNENNIALLLGAFITMYDIQEQIRHERNRENPNSNVITSLTDKLYKEPLHSIEILLPSLSSKDIVIAHKKALEEIDKRRQNRKHNGIPSFILKKFHAKPGGKESAIKYRPKPYGGYYNSNTKKRKNKRKTKKRR